MEAKKSDGILPGLAGMWFQQLNIMAELSLAF